MFEQISASISEGQVATDRGAGLADTVVGAQVHLLVFDTAPQTLDELNNISWFKWVAPVRLPRSAEAGDKFR